MKTKNTNKICAIDMDGVILNLIDTIKIALPCYIPENVLTYEFNIDLPKNLYPKHFNENDKYNNVGVDTQEIFRLFKSADYFSDCKHYSDVIPAGYDILTQIARLSNRIKVIIYTQCTNTQVAKVKLDKLEFYKRHYKWNNIAFHIVVGNDKLALDNVDYIIEDSLANLNKYSFNKTKGYIVNQSYNQEYYNPAFEYVFNNTKRFDTAALCIEDIINQL